MAEQTPGLFGLEHANRDFSNPGSWGKNIFNNAFPAALACYMSSQKTPLVYYRLNSDLNVQHGYIPVEDFFRIRPGDPDIFFAFENDYAPFRSLIVGTLPRADLIISTRSGGQALRPVEIKLTALPDNSTYDLSDEDYSCELVVRPDTIVYIALSIAMEFVHNRDELTRYLQHLPAISDWRNIPEMIHHIKPVADVLDALMRDNLHLQQPLIMQPVWKTHGKQLSLHEDALDIFVWSDFAFTRLFFRDAVNFVDTSRSTITRGARSIIWLAKMLLDFSAHGEIPAQQTIDRITLGTKNDKAFSVNGKITHPFMACDELTKPRIKRQEIRHVILGGGQNYLSPERRLDAAIAATPELFEER
jgi:hypothetical protein